jgi:hypothetical protein
MRVISNAGPGVKHDTQRALNVRNLNPKTALTQEQVAYLDHAGSYEPKPRLKDMDIQGIDQVMIIPTEIDIYPWLEDALGAKAFCRAYNEWAWKTKLIASSASPIPNSWLSTAVMNIERGFTSVRPKHLATSQPFVVKSKLNVPRMRLSAGTAKSTLMNASKLTSLPAHAFTSNPCFVRTARGVVSSMKPDLMPELKSIGFSFLSNGLTIFASADATAPPSRSMHQSSFARFARKLKLKKVCQSFACAIADCQTSPGNSNRSTIDPASSRVIPAFKTLLFPGGKMSFSSFALQIKDIAGPGRASQDAPKACLCRKGVVVIIVEPYD